ncbi:MAG: hypothetical protein AAF226_09415 [Verrucomicrobiota bacterium]
MKTRKYFLLSIALTSACITAVMIPHDAAAFNPKKIAKKMLGLKKKDAVKNKLKQDAATVKAVDRIVAAFQTKRFGLEAALQKGSKMRDAVENLAAVEPDSYEFNERFPKNSSNRRKVLAARTQARKLIQDYNKLTGAASQDPINLPAPRALSSSQFSAVAMTGVRGAVKSQSPYGQIPDLPERTDIYASPSIVLPNAQYVQLPPEVMIVYGRLP